MHPLIRQAAGHSQMVLSGSEVHPHYDPDTAKLLWIVTAHEAFVASPSIRKKTGLFYITGGFPRPYIMAIRPDGDGDVTATHVVWHHNNGAGVSYVPSPIIEGDWFSHRRRGVAHASIRRPRHRLERKFGRSHASIVSAAGLLYSSMTPHCRVVKPAGISP